MKKVYSKIEQDCNLNMEQKYTADEAIEEVNTALQIGFKHSLSKLSGCADNVRFNALSRLKQNPGTKLEYRDTLIAVSQCEWVSVLGSIYQELIPFKDGKEAKRIITEINSAREEMIDEEILQ